MQGAGAGLVLSFFVPDALAAKAKKPAPPPMPTPPPNAFLRIAPDDTVTVVLAHSEMGQGIWTGLAMLIAEELECDWAKVTSEHAPAAPVYGHPMMGIQMTGGSSTTNGEFQRYRTVGATAREMLIGAAAQRWKVDKKQCKVAKGVITHGDKSLRYGEVAEAAMKSLPPPKVELKKPKDWKIIGTSVKRLDTPAKITGTATFGMDIQFPDLHTAVVARPPAFGAKLQKFDPAAALKIPGVVKVVPTLTGVAVVAKHFWAAKLGRDALDLHWSEPEGGGVTTDALMQSFRELATKTGAIVADIGKVDAALEQAKTKHEAVYEVPYLAHAPMEPLNCTVKITGDHVEIWTGTQMPGIDAMVAAKLAGTTPDKVTVHTPFLGGGFGRRANPASDFVSEAVVIAKASGLAVKTVWTREDDIRGGYYRPAYVHRVRAGLDAAGKPVAWEHNVVGQSILAGTPFEPMMVKNGIDATSVEGVSDSPYLAASPAKRVSLHSPKTAVTVLWWRSVGNTHTAFVMESMIDELAHEAKQDPLAYRLALLEKHPRFANALKLAAEKAGWSTPPPAGRARGLAVHESFGTIVAEVAEVSAEGGKLRVHKVTAAVDCGTAVNPLGIEAQVQSSIAYGLTAALHGKLTIVNGKVQESNFHDYQPLRMQEMPEVSVHIIQSGEQMGGIGEPATAPIAPAVANAVFALTKQRLRTLPLRLA